MARCHPVLTGKILHLFRHLNSSIVQDYTCEKVIVSHRYQLLIQPALTFTNLVAIISSSAAASVAESPVHRQL